jgi:hypothetical protein
MMNRTCVSLQVMLCSYRHHAGNRQNYVFSIQISGVISIFERNSSTVPVCAVSLVFPCSVLRIIVITGVYKYLFLNHGSTYDI